MTKSKSKATNQSWQPVDRLSIILISILSLTIAILLLVVSPVGPKVRDFSWQEQTIGAEDRAFILTFNSPMERESVENNLKIAPTLPGKISWSGRRLAYTLENPATYGLDYEISIKGAREKIGSGDSQGKLLQPFTGQFESRNRAFAYIGVEGEEKGKLILYNLTGRQQSILTPADLIVTDFQPYPQGDRILFAAEEQKDWAEGLNKQQLYSVATGIQSQEGEDLAPGENLQVVLDSKDYQNLQFAIAQDGETIIVKRLSWRNKSDQDLWVIKGEEEAKPLKQELTGNFVITPDSQAVVIPTGKDGKGIGVVPLEPKTETIEFLPKFGQVLSFASDGTAAAMVDFNSDDPELRYARSLFLVTNQGVQKKLLDVKGSLIDCAFDANRKNLYCLLSELKEEEGYQEQPYLAKFDLEDTKNPTVTPLALLPEQLDVKMSLAPDGLGILIDQVIPTETDSAEALRSDSGQPVATSRLWLLLLPPPGIESPEPPALEELPLPGFKPQWMP
ncbi:MAG: hypothetical protein WA999_02665 [Spirulinaceae cyanobacterium]